MHKVKLDTVITNWLHATSLQNAIIRLQISIRKALNSMEKTSIVDGITKQEADNNIETMQKIIVNNHKNIKKAEELIKEALEQNPPIHTVLQNYN